MNGQLRTITIIRLLSNPEPIVLVEATINIVPNQYILHQQFINVSIELGLIRLISFLNLIILLLRFNIYLFRRKCRNREKGKREKGRLKSIFLGNRVCISFDS